MENDWRSTDIKAKELEQKIKEGKIQIPTYQRGVVWTEKKQKELIESIKLGYPFGSLIIFKYDDPLKPELLIDGLQRSTSLFNFINCPSNFFDEKDISDEILEKLRQKMDNKGSVTGQKRDIEKVIIDWVHSYKSSSEVRNMNEYDCASLLIEKFPGFTYGITDQLQILQLIKEISEIIRPIFDNYKNICQIIEDKPVPYIEITGDDSNLAEIFYRINDRGVKLSKQNKFAATWSDTPIKITNPKLMPLLDYVKNRYDYITKDGTTVFGYNSQTFLQESKLDVFELSYGFGMHISRNYPELFRFKDDPVYVDIIGFILINACLMGTKDDLKEMNENLINKIGIDNINTFLIKILSCISYVDDLLGPVTKFKGNKRLNKSPLHTDFQIVSIIASIFRIKHVKIEDEEYVFDLSNINSEWPKYDSLLKKNALKKYVYDIISGYWAGHGDNSLDTIIHENPEIYTKEIRENDFRAVMLSWFNRQLSERKELSAKDVKAPAEPEKVLLNLIYSNTFSAADQLSIEKFDIEHLATKKLMEKRLKCYKDLKLAISSFGNICLLPEYTNRKKQDSIIYDDLVYIDKVGNVLNIRDIEDKFTFTTEKDFEWIKNYDLSKEEFEDAYNDFVTKRFNKMNEMIISILYKNKN